MKLFGSNVQPRRRVKQKPKRWTCHCGDRKAYLVRCPDCGARRPE